MILVVNLKEGKLMYNIQGYGSGQPNTWKNPFEGENDPNFSNGVIAHAGNDIGNFAKGFANNTVNGAKAMESFIEQNEDIIGDGIKIARGVQALASDGIYAFDKSTEDMLGMAEGLTGVGMCLTSFFGF